MVVVTIDLWKGRDPNVTTRLGTIHIANDGTGTFKHGNYRGTFWGKDAYPELGALPLRARHVLLSKFPRRTLTVFHLISRVLRRANYY